jgi:hypothetical protein
VGGVDAPKDLIYLIPATRHFKTVGSNLSVNGFSRELDRTVLTSPVAPRGPTPAKVLMRGYLLTRSQKTTFKLLIETTVFGSHPGISPS